MTRPQLTRTLIAALLAVPFLWAADKYQVVRNARIPEYDETGNLQSMVYARQARIPKTGSSVAAIEGLKIDMYEEGEIDLSIEAVNCNYDREKRFARSKARVKITSPDMVITGEEFAYDGIRERFVIFKDARVELKNIQAIRLGPAPEPDAPQLKPAPAPAPAPPPAPPPAQP